MLGTCFSRDITILVKEFLMIKIYGYWGNVRCLYRDSHNILGESGRLRGGTLPSLCQRARLTNFIPLSRVTRGIKLHEVWWRVGGSKRTVGPPTALKQAQQGLCHCCIIKSGDLKFDADTGFTRSSKHHGRLPSEQLSEPSSPTPKRAAFASLKSKR